MALPDDLDLNLLRVLDVLLHEQGVGRAAARLGMTPSGVSRALGRLREAFDDPLLLRDGRRMVPTSTGAALRQPVARVLADIARLVDPLDPIDPTTAEFTFRVSSADYTEHVFWPPIVAYLAHHAPGVSLHAIHTDEPLAGLAESRLDVAIGVAGAIDAPDLAAFRLFDDGFVTVCRADHPASADAPWTPERFAALEHVLVAPAGRDGGVVDEALATLGLRRTVRALVSAFGAAFPVVSQTDLVVTLPARIVCQLAPHWNVTVQPTPVPLPRFALWAYWPVRRRRDPAHAWFRGVLRDVAQQLDS